MTTSRRFIITIIALCGLLLGVLPAQAADNDTSNESGITVGYGEDAVIGTPMTYDPQGSIVTRCIDKLSGRKSVKLLAALDNSSSTDSVLYEVWVYYQNAKRQNAFKGVVSTETYEVAGGQTHLVKVASLGKKYVKAGGKKYRHLSVEVRVLDLVTVDATRAMKVKSVYRGAKACSVELPNGFGK